MKQLARSKIGYDNEIFNNHGGIPIYGWNPFGFGCSKGCPDCWARKLAKRMSCEKCRNFEVHMHKERLYVPIDTQKPGIELCKFTNDWLDDERDADQIRRFICVTRYYTTRHFYITLTQNVKRLVNCVLNNLYWNKETYRPERFYHGLTIRNQADADEKLPIFLQIPEKKWISYEPAQEGIDWGLTRRPIDGDYHGYAGDGPIDYVITKRAQQLQGIIVGHNRYKGAAGTETLDHIRSAVLQCENAGVNVYVKQLWIDGKLCKNSDEFPEDLRQRVLPWEEAFESQLTQHGGCDETEPKK